MSQSQLRIGVNVGAGFPPFKWAVLYQTCARREAMEVLPSEEAYQHIADQFKELARHEDPTHSDIIDVKKIRNEEFFELRDKGGPLGNVAFRAFFMVCEESRSIVVIGAIKKQNEGNTPPGEILRMRRRARLIKSANLLLEDS